MADKKISELSSATTPLAGTEELALVQTGETKKTTVSSISSSISIDWGDIGGNVPDQLDLQSDLDDKADEIDLTNHVNDTANPHIVTKTQVGLSNADNTSDLDKPISTATQSALDDKANEIDLSNHVLDLANPHVVTQTQVGLSNADNTSDLDKPISTSTQTALDNKLSLPISDSLVQNRLIAFDANTNTKNGGPTIFEVGKSIVDAKNNLDISQLKISSMRNWNTTTISGNPEIFACVYDIVNDVLIASGFTGFNIYRSIDDGITWSTVNTGVDNFWFAAGYNRFTNVIVLGGGDSRIITSIDSGLNWIEQTTPTIIAMPTWQDAQYENGRYIVAGDSGSDGYIIWSDDSITWTEATYTSLSEIIQLAYGNGVWIGTGTSNNEYAISIDNGLNWTIGTISGLTNTVGVVFGDSIFLTSNLSGDVYISSNGTDWRQVASSVGSVESLLYSNNQFMMGGPGGQIYTSWDGVIWTLQISPSGSGTSIFASAAANTRTKSVIFGDRSGNNAIIRSTLPTVNVNDIFESDGESAYSVIPTTSVSQSQIFVGTSPPVDLSLFWWHSTQNIMYKYNTSDTAWHSTDLHSLMANEPGSLPLNAEMRFGNNESDAGVPRGWQTSRKIYVESYSWSSNNSVGVRLVQIVSDGNLGIGSIMGIIDASGFSNFPVAPSNTIPANTSIGFVFGSGPAGFSDSVVTVFYRYKF